MANFNPNDDPAKNAEASRKRRVAIEARMRGLRWADVAEAAGYADKASAYNAVKAAYKHEREAMSTSLLELRQQEDERDDDIRRRLYQIVTTKHYVVDGVNLVKGPDGEYLRDTRPVLAAIVQLQRLGDRFALRHGLNAPEKLEIALEARTDMEASAVVDAILAAADAVSLDPGTRMAMLEAAQHRLAVIEGEVVSDTEG